jgi:hypothetical protein
MNILRDGLPNWRPKQSHPVLHQQPAYKALLSPLREIEPVSAQKIAQPLGSRQQTRVLLVTRLDCDCVVAPCVSHIFNHNILARVRIHSICVQRTRRRRDVHVVNMHAVASVGMNCSECNARQHGVGQVYRSDRHAVTDPMDGRRHARHVAPVQNGESFSRRLAISTPLQYMNSIRLPRVTEPSLPLARAFHQSAPLPLIVPQSPSTLTFVKCSPCTREVLLLPPAWSRPAPYDGSGGMIGCAANTSVPKSTASRSRYSVMLDVILNGAAVNWPAGIRSVPPPARRTASTPARIAWVVAGQFDAPSTAPRSRTFRSTHCGGSFSGRLWC